MVGNEIWFGLAVSITSLLLFAGYYHPKPYYPYLLLPIAAALLLFQVFYLGYKIGADGMMNALLPHVDNSKLGEIRSAIYPVVHFINGGHMAAIAIVGFGAALAGLLQVAGFVYAKRDKNQTHD